jgi:hypothetical protein
MLADSAENPAIGKPGGCDPFGYCALDPKRHGNRPDVTALADQIDNGPMPLTNLDVFNIQSR